MTANFSKTQIDRLGDRLREGSHSEADLQMLDEYRRSFRQAYDEVVKSVRKRLNQPTTGRPAKSTVSIVEKLRRESIRLSQMQDIAGCRVIVENITEQERFVTSLRTLFPKAVIMDRREKPSHGYRAVHAIPSAFDKPVEVQVRTVLQHLWAELSEKASDLFDPMIKYGGGDNSFQCVYTKLSNAVAMFEGVENRLTEAKRKRLAGAINEIADIEQRFANEKREFVLRLKEELSRLDELRDQQ